MIFLYEFLEFNIIVYDLDIILIFFCDFRRYYDEFIKDERCLKLEYYRYIKFENNLNMII